MQPRDCTVIKYRTRTEETSTRQRSSTWNCLGLLAICLSFLAAYWKILIWPSHMYLCPTYCGQRHCISVQFVHACMSHIVSMISFKQCWVVTRPGSRLEKSTFEGLGSGRFDLGSKSNFGGVVWLFSSRFISYEYYFCSFCMSVLVHLLRILHYIYYFVTLY